MLLGENRLFDYVRAFAVKALPNIESYRRMIAAIRLCVRSRLRECLRCQSSRWIVCGWRAARRKLIPLEKWMTFVRGLRSLSLYLQFILELGTRAPRDLQGRRRLVFC